MKPIRWSAIALIVCLLCSLFPYAVSEEYTVPDEAMVLDKPIMEDQSPEEDIAVDEDTVVSNEVEPSVDEVELSLESEQESNIPDINDKEDVEEIEQESPAASDEETIGVADENSVEFAKAIEIVRCSANYQDSLTVGDYTISIFDDKTCYIDKYSGTTANLVIPSVINGYKVTTIGWSAFSNMQFLRSIVFPETLEAIGNDAFNNCNNLESIAIKGVNCWYIGNYAFQNCIKLRALSINCTKYVVKIGDYAFQNCTSLETINFNVKDFELGMLAFDNCSRLKKVGIPSDLTNFWWSYGVFSDCVSLQSITIPKVYSKCDYNNSWFSGCYNLTVYFQNGITSLPEYALCGHGSVKKIVIPQSVTSIGYQAFLRCQEDIVIYAENIYNVAEEAFEGCGKIYVINGSNTHRLFKNLGIKVIPFDPYAPTGITLKVSGDMVLNPKQGVQLSAALSPSNARSTLKWKSSKKGVATVSKNGYVKAKKKGTTTITVSTRNGKKASIKITVKNKPKKVTLSPKRVAINIGKSSQLRAALPKNTYATLSYSSSNAGVAKVDQSGKVTAVKGGQATITVTTSNGKKASCLVTVLTGPAPTSLTLNATTCTLKPKGKFTIVPKINSGASTAYTFTTSNKKVATVAANGIITAKKKGKAVITVRTHNGLTAKITVIVKKK